MHNVTVERTIKVELSLTADDWELYTASMDCAEAAGAINRAIEAAVNSGATRTEATEAALKVMRKLSRFGAVDSEPICRLRMLMNELYSAPPDYGRGVKPYHFTPERI